MMQIDCKEVQTWWDMAEIHAQAPSNILSHCQQCKDCHKYGQQLMALRALIANQAKVAVPKDFDFKLRQRITATKVSPQPWWQWVKQPALGTAAAAVVLLALIAGVDRLYLKNPSLVPDNSTATNQSAPPTVKNSSLPDKIGSAAPITTAPAPKEIAPKTEFIAKGSEAAGRTATTTDNRHNRFEGRDVATDFGEERDVRRIIKDVSNGFTSGFTNGGVRVRRGAQEDVVPVSRVVYGAQSVVNIVDPKDVEIENITDSDDANIF